MMNPYSNICFGLNGDRLYQSASLVVIMAWIVIALLDAALVIELKRGTSKGLPAISLEVKIQITRYPYSDF